MCAQEREGLHFNTSEVLNTKVLNALVSSVVEIYRSFLEKVGFEMGLKG